MLSTVSYVVPSKVIRFIIFRSSGCDRTTNSAQKRRRVQYALMGLFADPTPSLIFAVIQQQRRRTLTPSSIVNVISVSHACTCAVCCMHARVQCVACMHVCSVLYACTCAVCCMHARVQCVACMHVCSVLHACTCAVCCMHARVQCVACMHVCSALHACTCAVCCMHACTQQGNNLTTVSTF